MWWQWGRRVDRSQKNLWGNSPRSWCRFSYGVRGGDAKVGSSDSPGSNGVSLQHEECARRWTSLADSEASKWDYQASRGRYRPECREPWTTPLGKCFHLMREEKKWTGSGLLSCSEVRGSQDEITPLGSRHFSIHKTFTALRMLPFSRCIYSHKCVFLELSYPLYWYRAYPFISTTRINIWQTSSKQHKIKQWFLICSKIVVFFFQARLADFTVS